MNDYGKVIRHSTILLFSAQATNIDSIQAALEDFELTWHVIDDPDEVLESAITFSPDLICLDSKGGNKEIIKLCQMIKESPAVEHIPVLVLADLVDRETRNAIFNAGAVDVIATPLSECEIQAKVGMYLQYRVFRSDREKIESSVEALRLSEEIFAAAFHTSADMISISRVDDGTFINVNRSVVDVLGYHPTELIGKSSIEIGLWSDIKQRQQMSEMLKEDGMFRDFEVSIKRKDGSVGIVSISGTLIWINEEPCVLASLRDITDQKRAEEALMMRERINQEFQERLRALFEVNLELTLKETLNELCYSAVELGARLLGFERIGLWFYDDHYEHTIGSYGTNEQGDVRDERDYRLKIDKDSPEYLLVKGSSRVMVWEDVDLRRGDGKVVGEGWVVRALMWDGDNAIGFVSVDKYFSGTAPQSYLPDLVALYGSLLGHLITRKRTEEALRTSEQTSREFQERLQTLVEVNLELTSKETVDDFCYSAVELGREKLGFERIGLWFFDDDLKYLLGSYGTNEEGGVRDERDLKFELWDESRREHQLIDEGLRVKYWEDSDLAGDGRIVGQGWLALALMWDGAKAIGFISTDNYFSGEPIGPYLLDFLALYGSMLGHLITRKRTEEALRASEQNSRYFQEHLRSLLEVSLELALKESVDDFCYSAIRLGLEKLGFERMGLWFFDEALEYIVGSYGTDGIGNVIDERDFKYEFGEESREYQIVNEGLRVKTWEDVQLVDRGGNFRKGWLALALLWDGAKAIGLISIDNYVTGKSPPPYIADLLALYGGTLGHLITRKRVEESLRISEGTSREFQERLRALHAINFELYTKETVNELCYSAVGLAMSELGFERLGISFFDDAQENILGVYGTNEEGGIRDERHKTKKIDAIPRDAELINSGKRVDLWEDVELLNYDGVVGQGWVALALLWDGTKAIGLISIDNYFSGTPPKPYTVDLLALFGNTLGHLITHKRSEKEIERYVERLQVLRQIDRAVLISEQPEAIAKVVVDPLCSLLDCHAVGIIKYDPVTASTQVLASTLKIVPIGKIKPEIIQKLSSGETVEVTSGSEVDETFLDQGISAYALVPLVDNDKLFGLLLIGFTHPGRLNKEKVEILEQVSTSLAIAFRQHELMQQLHRYTDDLEALVDARTADLEEKTKELEAFMYSVSHDLRAPLRAMHGFSQIIRQEHDWEITEAVDSYLDRIQQNALRMGNLIDDLLALSRIGQKEMTFTQVDFGGLVEEIIAELSTDNQLGSVKVEVADLPDAYGDRVLLRQVLFNLITNGIKYSRSQEAPLIEIGSLEKDGKQIYFVRDNGVGFDPRYKDKLFGVFQRLHSDSDFEGMGIGLAIVERVIKRHGGEIWAEGQVNGGATFFFTLGDVPAIRM